jgi:hypothetical protein
VKPTAFDPERMDVGVATLSAFEYRQTGNAEYSTVHFMYKSFCITCTTLWSAVASGSETPLWTSLSYLELQT